MSVVLHCGYCGVIWRVRPKESLYVLVANPEKRYAGGALTDVLNMYEDGVYAGVERRKFGMWLPKWPTRTTKTLKQPRRLYVAFGLERGINLSLEALSY